MKKLFALLIALVMVSGFTVSAHATLIDRGSFAYDDGAGHTGSVNLIYDDGFDITWVGDGNFAQTSGFDADGRMNWGTSVAWAGGLTIGGFDDWRLPTTVDGTYEWGFDGTTTAGYKITTSEMSHLYYTELGNRGYYDTSGIYQGGSGLQNAGDFENIRWREEWYDTTYWSGTEHSDENDKAWSFVFHYGYQSTYNKEHNFGGLAVRSGDVAAVAAVPEPTTIALLGIGLAGLAGAEIRRRRKKRTVDKS